MGSNRPGRRGHPRLGFPIKARKDFKEALNATKGTWESDTAQNVSDYSNGLKSWSDFLLRKHEIELKYFEDREAVYKQFNLTEDEDYQELLKKKADYEAAWLKKNAALKVEEAKRMQQVEETQAQMDFYTPGNALYGKGAENSQLFLNNRAHSARFVC